MTSASSDNYNCDIGTINGCMIQTEGAEESKAAGPVSCRPGLRGLISAGIRAVEKSPNR
jgi:hypothetical protein